MADTTQGGGGATGGADPKPDRGGSRPGISPEDDKGIVRNPNNPAYEADAENRKKQARGG